MIESYPLYWPESWPRTKPYRRDRSRFDQSPGRARDKLVNELKLLGARDVIISTNVALRRDGLPYANQREPDDTGVAAWFVLDGEQQCIPCDRWSRVWENMYAIAKSIEALRGLDRWGAKSMVRAAFKGFAALPSPGIGNWRDVLGRDIDSRDQMEDRYRQLARERHPDHGGSAAMMADLNAARDAARKEMADG